MKITSLNKCLNGSFLAGLGICLISAASLKADTLVTFSVDMSAQVAAGTFTNGVDTVAARGTFNGYGTFYLTNDPTAVGLATNIYSGTTNDVIDINGQVMQYKYWNSDPQTPGTGWESPANEGANRAVNLPLTGGATLVLPTQYFSDAGPAVTNTITFMVNMAQQINLGLFTNGPSTVYARGSFNGFDLSLPMTNDPSILVTNQYGLVSSNVYVVTTNIVASPNATEGFKYYFDPGAYWESPNVTNSNPSESGNRFFINVPQTLPLVDFSDAPFAPVSQVTFSVDMSIQTLAGVYSNYPAYLAGSFNSWSTSATPMTNDPFAPNTNIYSASVNVGQGSTVYYKFTYQNNGTIWENPATTGGGNRTFVVPTVASTNLPTVYWNDLLPDDVFLVPTPVTFAVDMTNAVEYTTNGPGHVFDPSSDTVYINGQFANNGNWYAWAGGINPVPAPPGYQMVEQGLTMIYTNTILIPPGTPVGFAYKYGMDPFAINQGPLDDEAGFGQNHFRVVRTTANPPYVMPQDTFGYQYGEPFFNYGASAAGHLTVGAESGGSIPITWLGRPGAHLQVTTDLTGGAWQDLAATDGTNWTLGYSSTNGFVSQTNWPADDKAFFRLIKL